MQRIRWRCGEIVCRPGHFSPIDWSTATWGEPIPTFFRCFSRCSFQTHILMADSSRSCVSDWRAHWRGLASDRLAWHQGPRSLACKIQKRCRWPHLSGDQQGIGSCVSDDQKWQWMLGTGL